LLSTGVLPHETKRYPYFLWTIDSASHFRLLTLPTVVSSLDIFSGIHPGDHRLLSASIPVSLYDFPRQHPPGYSRSECSPAIFNLTMVVGMPFWLSPYIHFCSSHDCHTQAGVVLRTLGYAEISLPSGRYPHYFLQLSHTTCGDPCTTQSHARLDARRGSRKYRAFNTPHRIVLY
jgi:hypothetical protein